VEWTEFFWACQSAQGGCNEVATEVDKCLRRADKSAQAHFDNGIEDNSGCCGGSAAEKTVLRIEFPKLNPISKGSLMSSQIG
jgi:hypothetical protein